jgi:hypothetical protein
VIFQVKGGRFCRMLAAITSASDSSTKRFQLMLTSQPAYTWKARTAAAEKRFQRAIQSCCWGLG